MNITRPIITTGLLFLLSAAAVADRAIWVQQIVAEINTANVQILDTTCPVNSWLEVTPGETADAVRYRCGSPIWPFYRSGKSHAAAKALENTISTP